MVWNYRSHRDLIDADYRLRGRVPCPICGTVMVMYQQLDHFPEFLDTETFAQHLDGFRHADPPLVPIDGKSAAAGDY